MFMLMSIRLCTESVLIVHEEQQKSNRTRREKLWQIFAGEQKQVNMFSKRNENKMSATSMWVVNNSRDRRASERERVQCIVTTKFTGFYLIFSLIFLPFAVRVNKISEIKIVHTTYFRFVLVRFCSFFFIVIIHRIGHSRKIKHEQLVWDDDAGGMMCFSRKVRNFIGTENNNNNSKKKQNTKEATTTLTPSKQKINKSIKWKHDILSHKDK